MSASGNRLVAANATGCLEVFSTPYPETSWQIPWIHSLFGNVPAVATGIAAALKVKGKHDVRVVAQGGDGGTTDIGFGCLSGMMERNDDVLYICYDNEAYMNTGVQRSSATPPAARTATTTAHGSEPGNSFGQGKNMPLIAMAHGIPYQARAGTALSLQLRLLQRLRRLRIRVPLRRHPDGAGRDLIGSQLFRRGAADFFAGLASASPQRDINSVMKPCSAAASTVSGAKASATVSAMW